VGERKITLNFALAEDMPVDPETMIDHFSPERFIIKVTPVNPTCSAKRNKISSHIVPGRENYEILEALEAKGYDVILSIGELKENDIGSNCGQHIMNYMREKEIVPGGYTYPVINVEETV
jgi:23S rRNA (adenine2503-C2)-methyltransferase